MKMKNLKTYFKNIGTSLMIAMSVDGYRRTVTNDMKNSETDRILNETIRKSAELERKLNDQIEQELVTNSEVQTNLSKIKECLDNVQTNVKNLNDMKSNNDNKDLIVENCTNVNESANKANTLIDKILELINNSSNNSNNFDINIHNIFNEYNNFFNNLTTIQKGALAHTLFCIFILWCIFDILVAYYSDKLIIYFNLENKHPILAKYVKLRRKLQSYYIKFNFIVIILITLFVLGENILILLDTL